MWRSQYGDLETLYPKTRIGGQAQSSLVIGHSVSESWLEVTLGVLTFFSSKCHIQQGKGDFTHRVIYTFPILRSPHMTRTSLCSDDGSTEGEINPSIHLPGGGKPFTAVLSVASSTFKNLAFSVRGRFCTDCDFSSVTSSSLSHQKSKFHHHNPKTQRQPLTSDQTLETGEFQQEVESDEDFHEILGVGEVIESWSSPADGVSTSWCNKESSAASMARSAVETTIAVVVSTTNDVYQASTLLNLPPTCFIRYGPIKFKLAPMDSSHAIGTD
ncbi:hypothetical protein F5146DRAFT_999279 [Armillaria mellea]|nr:hypothetical protein F5146DRAFT_999279 [Armillaria mellea]